MPKDSSLSDSWCEFLQCDKNAIYKMRIVYTKDYKTTKTTKLQRQGLQKSTRFTDLQVSVHCNPALRIDLQIETFSRLNTL